MCEIDMFYYAESAEQVVAQDSRIRHLWLTDDAQSAWFVEEEVVDDTGPPCGDSMLATEAGVTNKRVSASIEVASVAIDTKMVLLWETLAMQ